MFDTQNNSLHTWGSPPTYTLTINILIHHCSQKNSLLKDHNGSTPRSLLNDGSITTQSPVLCFIQYLLYSIQVYSSENLIYNCQNCQKTSWWHCFQTNLWFCFAKHIYWCHLKSQSNFEFHIILKLTVSNCLTFATLL